MQVERIFQGLYQKIAAGPRDPRRPITVPYPNIDPPPAAPAPVPAAPKPFVAEQDYITIRINQLFLQDARKWFTAIEPIVFFTAETLYDGKTRAVPYVVGPKKDDGLPKGTIMRNQTVLGTQPYRGGPVTFTVVLSQMPVGNAARDLLDVVQDAGTALLPTLGIEAYTKMGSVVLNGFEKLAGLNAVSPLLGLRETINPDAGDVLTPRHIALIDISNPNPNEFFVIDDMLYHGPDRARAKPYQDADFVLFQIGRTPSGRRTDITGLPFYPLWQKAVEAAGKTSTGAWDDAKANFTVLSNALTLSPDLTWAQSEELYNAYFTQLVNEHQKAEKRALAGPDEATDRTRLARITSIMALK